MAEPKLKRREFIGAAAGLGAMLMSGCRLPWQEEQSVLASLPDLRIPRPTGYIRTNWLEDPFSFCSYSCLPPNRHGAGLRRMLAKPVGGRLFITGEATSVPSPAMVHGAIESGRRTAGEIESVAESGASVVVVGAGASGLACARRLVDAGFDVTILEGRERVGGRIWTEQLDDAPVELGASWIHGVEGNPVAAMAAEAGVEAIPFEYDYGFVDERQEREGMQGEHQLKRARHSFDGDWDQAAVTALSSLLPARRTPGLQWAVTYEIAQEYGADPEDLAVLATWEGDYLIGGDAILDGSYTDVVVGAMGDLPVKLDSKVMAVRYDQTSVSVEVEGAGSYEADYAVVTVPIGVLKRGTIGFDPELPSANRQAIDGLGSGLLDKLWLSFDEVFWDPDAEMIHWIDPKRPGLWAEWVNGYRYLGKPILVGFNGGSQAADLSGWSDRDVLQSGLSALEHMFW